MRLGYMFSGQGAQFPGMGRDLYEGSSAAKAVFESADEVLHRSISRLCFDGTPEELTACANCQPAIYTMSQACLAAFHERFPDVVPAVCGGLSLGELSALSAAGVFSFEDGLRLVAKRGELMDVACRETHGGMAAVLGGDPSEIEAVCLEAGADVANLNCPGQIVISGEDGALSKAVAALEGKVTRAVMLTVAGAYHSRLMDTASRQFGEVLAGVSMNAPAVPVVQNVTGDVVDDPGVLRRNLTLQVCSSVRWESCARAMMSRSDMLVEFGPGTVLCGFMKRIDRMYPSGSVGTLATLDALASKLA